MLDLGRLTIFVGAEDTDIEIEARIFEVIGITAVKGDLLFRREDEPDIIVAFISIQIVVAALIEGYHVRAQTGLVFALLLDLSDDFCRRLARLVADNPAARPRSRAR